MDEAAMAAAIKELWGSLPKETHIAPHQFSRLDGQCVALMPEQVIPQIHCYEDGWL
jgi:hypothetical protein